MGLGGDEVQRFLKTDDRQIVQVPLERGLVALRNLYFL